MSQPFADVRLRNTGTRPCQLRGYPTMGSSTVEPITPQLHGLRVLDGVYVWRRATPSQVLLRPGGSAFFTIETATAYQGGKHIFTIHDLTATLPGGTTRILIHVELEASHASHRPTILHVSPFRTEPGKPTKSKGRP